MSLKVFLLTAVVVVSTNQVTCASFHQDQDQDNDRERNERAIFKKAIEKIEDFFSGTTTTQKADVPTTESAGRSSSNVI